MKENYSKNGKSEVKSNIKTKNMVLIQSILKLNEGPGTLYNIITEKGEVIPKRKLNRRNIHVYRLWSFK